MSLDFGRVCRLLRSLLHVMYIPQVISSIDRDFEPQSPAVAVAAKETATKEKVKVQMGSQLGQLG